LRGLILQDNGTWACKIWGFGMRPKERAKTPQSDLFRLKLVNLIDLRHELCGLGEKINWSELIDEFGALYSEHGRPGVPIRLMAGLHYLKHAFGLSDEVVVKSWVENPYWQYFCGEEYFQHRLPIDPSQMTRFRTRLGASGCEKLLQLTIAAGLEARAVKPSSFTQVTVDTTVQEKAIAFPTDGRLYHKGRVWLVRLAKRAGIELRQSYLRVGKQSLFMQQRYSAARQMRRARRELKRSKVYLGRVYRDIQRKLPRQSAAVRELFAEPLARIGRLLAQQRHDHNKLYSLHAPEVECIAKGKVHKKYEFGVKVSLAVTQRDNFIVGALALPGTPFDGHTLSSALHQVEKLTGIKPERCFVDRGYRGHGIKDVSVHIAGQKRGVTRALRRALKRRNAIEPIIGHAKHDGLMGRNYLLGRTGDAMNAILAAAGHNLRIILRKLRLSWLAFLQSFLRDLRAGRLVCTAA
jgi:IS5 family transposase